MLASVLMFKYNISFYSFPSLYMIIYLLISLLYKPHSKFHNSSPPKKTFKGVLQKPRFCKHESVKHQAINPTIRVRTVKITCLTDGACRPQRPQGPQLQPQMKATIHHAQCSQHRPPGSVLPPDGFECVFQSVRQSSRAHS